MKEAYYLKNHLQPPNALLICLATCAVDQFRCQEPRVSILSLFRLWPFKVSSPWSSCLQATRLGPAVPGVTGSLDMRFLTGRGTWPCCCIFNQLHSGQEMSKTIKNTPKTLHHAPTAYTTPYFPNVSPGRRTFAQ